MANSSSVSSESRGYSEAPVTAAADENVDLRLDNTSARADGSMIGSRLLRGTSSLLSEN